MTTPPVLPALVRGEVRHLRRRPFRHGLNFKTYEWLVELDHSDLPGGARLLPADHFGGEADNLREALVAFAASSGESVEPGDRLIMLASARSSGYVFNPLSVYWCLTESGHTRWAVLEIHNTYGDRHAHLLHPDDRGRAEIAKEFYVSPFFEISGSYKVALELDSERVLVSVNLHQEDELIFSASFAGSPVPATGLNRLRAAVRTPLATWQTMLRIRLHGIWLWLRRLPVVPRPEHEKQKGML